MWCVFGCVCVKSAKKFVSKGTHEILSDESREVNILAKKRIN
jgi:hypothetical protein